MLNIGHIVHFITIISSLCGIAGGALESGDITDYCEDMTVFLSRSKLRMRVVFFKLRGQLWVPSCAIIAQSVLQRYSNKSTQFTIQPAYLRAPRFLNNFW